MGIARVFQLNKRMKLYKLFFWSIFLFTCIHFNASSQEYLIGKGINEKLLLNKHHNLLKSVDVPADTIELPVLDDFSKPGIYPNTAFWADDEVYINYTRAINPPSIGVATFDMFNHNGEIHHNANNKVFLADSLTSRPINLDYPSDSNIFLSFSYQYGGNGDMPEEQDSLIVEFYSPENDEWDLVYSIPGGSEIDFNTVIIPVDSTKYLHSGFRFKFKNHGSFENLNFIPYKERDCDHWHLDYVYLDKHRTINDTIIEDISITHTFWPILEEYTSIPWNHCTRDIIFTNRKKELELSLLSTFLDPTYEPNIGASFNITDLKGDGSPLYDYIGNQNISPFTPETFLVYYDYDFISNSIDSAEFEMEAYIITNDEPDIKSTLLRQNDTLTYVQKFYNYYSYDDGSAEYGYGISDEGADNARIAVRYNTFTEDTLRGVYISFLQYNLPEDLFGGLGFNLAVWLDKDNEPDTLIYSEFLYVEYGKSVNSFAYYPLDTNIIIDGKFYIGIIQRTDDYLNIGFDLNTNSRVNTLYNIDGTWDTTKYEGSLMIRPYFGQEIEITNIQNSTIHESQFSLFPNPVQYNLNISFNEQHSIEFINIYNTSGILLQSFNYKLDNIDLSYLPNGLYFIQLKLEGFAPKTEKLIIQR
ncbi:T9SS type A sorting domain-containing protein [Bacteroidota bacterium]